MTAVDDAVLDACYQRYVQTCDAYLSAMEEYIRQLRHAMAVMKGETLDLGGVLECGHPVPTAGIRRGHRAGYFKCETCEHWMEKA